ncbi:hypothetical protein FBU30_009162 [Linnemannia zychae]|nr:hypothetical protein FBU30_009162 [Linnemannia zychae]
MRFYAIAIVIIILALAFVIAANVAITFGAFAPAETILSAGNVVTWINKDDPAARSRHTTTLDDGLWDSGFWNSRDAFTRPFSTPGDFPYHCKIHAGETGIVKVFFSLIEEIRE